MSWSLPLGARNLPGVIRANGGKHGSGQELAGRVTVKFKSLILLAMR